MLNKRPPCWIEGQPCPNDCARAHYQHVVMNYVNLHGAWSGWRLAGVRLVNPHCEFIVPQVLDRLMYRESVLFRRKPR